MYESTTQEMLDMNIEELYNMAHRNNWDMETLQAWSIFKIAQYLEKLAYEKGVIIR
jgi:hypothetical protein